MSTQYYTSTSSTSSPGYYSFIAGSTTSGSAYSYTSSRVVIPNATVEQISKFQKEFNIAKS